LDSITLLVIAIGLAMDAFAVSITSGCIAQRMKLRSALRIAFFFGGFQALMPLIGYIIGTSLRVYLQNIDHWIAFGLLTFIGVKMIKESSYITKETDTKNKNTDSIPVLFTLAIATSIDALAVGITFSLLDVNILFCAGMIGVVTFLLSLLGIWMGCRFGRLFSDKIEILGGLVLIGIGIKILIEHLFFSM